MVGTLERLVEAVKEELNNEEYTVKVEVVQKNNVEKQGIIIRNEHEGMVPVVYTEDQLKDIEIGIKSVNEAAREIISIRFSECVTAHSGIKESVENFTKEFVLSKVVRKLIGKEKNEALLSKLAYEEVCDLAATYSVVLSSNTEGSSSVAVSLEIMNSLEITKEELQEAAIRNEKTSSRFEVKSMNAIMAEMFGEELTEDDTDNDLMYVISNKDRYLGAVAILHEDVLKKVAKKTKGDFYILPSSIHECIATPVQGGGEEELCGLREMVASVNVEQLAPEDLLSFTVYICRVPKDESESVVLEIA